MVKSLFDSGASSSFISSRMSKKLGLMVRQSSLKSVATAAGKGIVVEGAVRFTLELGPTQLEVTAHVLPSFLNSVDLILGQDFMKTHSIQLNYNPTRCTIHSGKFLENGLMLTPDECARHTKNASCSAAIDVHSRSSVDPSLVDIMSPAEAYRYLKSRSHAVFLTMVTPSDQLPQKTDMTQDEDMELDQIPDQVPDLTSTSKNNPSPCLDHVPIHFRTQLMALLDAFQDVFSETPQAGGAKIPPLEQTIELIQGAKPPFKKNYRLSPVEFEELKKQVRDLLDKNILLPTVSPYGAPVLFIKKPDGRFRFCLDYRALNDITIKLRYPLPRIDDLLDAARGATCFSCLDMAGGFHQLPISSQDIPKTAFTTPFGQYAWRCLPMGLSNAPSQFQRTVNKIFEEYIGQFVLIYLDDVMILSKTPADHLDHLRMVFEKIREHGLQIRMSKCKFLQPQVKYLGHILSADGVAADPDKIKSLTDWEFPDTPKGVMQFLGLANYFRKFIPNLSRLAAPLYRLMKKGTIFQKGEEALLAFKAIKETLISPPVLAYPDPNLPYELISDASITGCGAVLTQESRPIAYFSSKFSSAERNYTTGEQELLGIIKALKEWRCYLEGCQGLTIVTDHNPLTFFSKQPTLSRRQARWNEFMSRFQFTVKYRPGASNPADPLSRIHAEATTAVLLALTVSEFSTDMLERIKSESSQDPHFQNDENVKNYIKKDGYWLHDSRVVVPASIREEIIREHHGNLVSGHFSWARTLDLISRHFWWPNMRQEIQAHVQSCLSCQRNKASNLRPYGLLQPLAIPDERWHTVTMDFIFDLPKSSFGHDGIMVLVDKLTKYVCLAPVKKTATSEDVARIFISHVYQHHGMPKVLISDRDTRFISKFWKEFCRCLQTQSSNRWTDRAYKSCSRRSLAPFH
jgi:hypothetical protein